MIVLQGLVDRLAFMRLMYERSLRVSEYGMTPK